MKNKLLNGILNAQNRASILGAGIPIVISVCKIPVFSYLFSPSEWGVVALVLVSFSFASMALFSWQLACVWRFYNEAKVQNALPQLWNILHRFSRIGSSIMLFGALLFCIFQPSLSIYILAAAVQSIFAQWVSTQLIVLQLENRRQLWAWCMVLASAGAFGLTICLATIFKLEACSVFVGNAIMQIILYLVLLYKKEKKTIQQANNDYFISPKEIFHYGMLTVAIELSLTVLSLADRYILAAYCGNWAVGVYSQAFTIAQFAILGISGIFFARYNPLINAVLSQQSTRFKSILPAIGMRYCIVFLPLVVWIPLFSTTICEVLLAPEYRSASSIFLPISVSYFLYGLSLLSENAALFAKKYKALLIVYGIALIVSIVSTIFAVKLWGFTAAAWTTLLAFLIVFLRFNPLLLFNKKQYLLLLQLSIILGLQCIIHCFLGKSIVIQFLEAFIFGVSYCAFVWWKMMRKEK